MEIKKGERYYLVCASPSGYIVCEGVFVINNIEFDDGVPRYIFTDRGGMLRYVSPEDPKLPFDKIRKLTKLDKALYEE